MKEILNFGTAVIFQIFYLFIQLNAKNLAFLLFLLQIIRTLQF